MKLELRGVTAGYGRNLVLRGCDLQVGQGELVAVLGPSGSSKTTLLRVIAGIVAPTSGSVLIDGRDVTSRPVGKRDLAFIQENWALYSTKTVFENCEFPLRMQGVTAKERRVRVEAILASLFDTSASAQQLYRRLPSELSGGQKQRVALARALVRRDVGIVLADEPFSNLDLPLRLQLRAQFREQQQRHGFTSLLVTHDQADAVAIADRIAFMADGKVLQVGTAEALIEAPQFRMVAEFVGPDPMNLSPGLLQANSLLIDDRKIADATYSDTAFPQPVFVGVRSEQTRCVVHEASNITGRVRMIENAFPARTAIVDVAGKVWRVPIPREDVCPALGELVGIRFAPEDVHLFRRCETADIGSPEEERRLHIACN